MTTSKVPFLRAAAAVVAGFARARSGSTALIFGLAFVPLMLGIGAAIDYGRATMIKTRLQAATDAAVLAAGGQSRLTQTARQNIAKNVVFANLGPIADSISLTVAETEPAVGAYRVQAEGRVNTSLLKFAHFETIRISAISEAVASGGGDAPIEIALALDNTGSMRNDMPALKSAAKTLVQNVMGGGAKTNVRVSVVPYVAAVNPGLTDMSMVDTGMTAPATANWFRWAWLGYDKNCTPVWGLPGPGPGSGSSGDTSGDARDLIQLLDPFRRVAQQLFGVGAAFAGDVTPNTIPPLVTQKLRSSATNREFTVPLGFSLQPKASGTGGCDWAMNPGAISNYELFKRLLDNSGGVVKWKGCVEARVNATEVAAANAAWGTTYKTGVDYDVTDIPPTAGDAASLFTPYFWPDEPDYKPSDGSAAAPGAFVTGSGAFHNNYLVDFAVPATWNWVANPWNNGQSILKYDGRTKAAIIKETAPDTYGPNAACPEPVTRLTNNYIQALAAIDAMNFWYNGGTVISEGLTWAWRTLSPEKPYADGAPYTDTKSKKIIVLMTDGVNGLAENGNAASANISDYSAYGYMGASRLNFADSVTTYADLRTFLDNRLKKACDNAKAKGISIYTVMFNHSGFLNSTEQAHSAALLSYCASKPENAFVAASSAALSDAFGNIAVSATASPLRLTR